MLLIWRFLRGDLEGLLRWLYFIGFFGFLGLDCDVCLGLPIVLVDKVYTCSGFYV